MKTKIGCWLLIFLLFGLAVLCPRPWFTIYHFWGRDIELGFPTESISIQIWDKTQAEPAGRLVVNPVVPGLLLNLMIFLFSYWFCEGDCFLIMTNESRSKPETAKLHVAYWLTIFRGFRRVHFRAFKAALIIEPATRAA